MRSKLYLILIVLIFGLAFTGIQTWESFKVDPYINYSNQTSFIVASKLSAQLERTKDKEYILRVSDKEISLKGNDLANLIEPFIRDYTQKEEYRISREKMTEFLTEIALSVNSAPLDARITIIKGIPTTLFKEVSGEKLNIQESSINILEGIIMGRPVIDLVIDYVKPGLTMAKFEKLKIDSLLAVGESDFAGSPAARIHNIKVSSAKYNGRLIPPRKTFSFNKILGEVTAETGYLPELVIKHDKITPEYGGGICQVSTTLYRAALNAGLPIEERKNHSFTVGYYNPQGLDATIYPGVVDLKFKNDTGEYILIQTKIEGTKLIFELYGRDDGRIVEIDGPYQYPREEGGSYAYLTRTVTKGDEEVEEDFNSTYRSKDEFPLERNPLE